MADDMFSDACLVDLLGDAEQIGDEMVARRWRALLRVPAEDRSHISDAAAHRATTYRTQMGRVDPWSRRTDPARYLAEVEAAVERWLTEHEEEVA